EVAAFQIARQNNNLAPRVIMGLKEDKFHIFPEEKGIGLFTGFGNDFLKIGPAKFVTDGGIGQKTGAMREPFENSDECGILCEDEKSLTKRMERAHKAGFQIAVHAVGDRAIEMVLNAYDSILSRFPKPHR